MLDGFKRVQIIHLGTGITNLRRAVPRRELEETIRFALSQGGLTGTRYADRPGLKTMIVATLIEHMLETHKMEIYRDLPPPLPSNYWP